MGQHYIESDTLAAVLSLSRPLDCAFPEIWNWRGAESGLVLNTKYRLHYRKPDRQTKRRTCVTQQHGEFAKDYFSYQLKQQTHESTSLESIDY